MRKDNPVHLSFPLPNGRGDFYFEGGESTVEAVETRVAVIAVIVREGSPVAALNELLHQYGTYIIGRMGVPYREKGVNIISVAMDAPGDVISALSGKLGRLEGVTAKNRLRPGRKRMKGRSTMNLKKKLLALGLSLALALPLTACGRNAAEPEQPEEPARTEGPVAETPDGTEADTAHFRIAALKGPTAMGLVKLMKDNDEMTGALLSSVKPYEGEVGNLYTFTLAGSADEVTPALIKGELDMACVPANLAAVLYGKTEGAMEVMAVNTLGVLYIVENGDTVQSMADLKGQTVVAAGKGSTPEYALRYLLSENGIDPDKDVTIDWKSEHSECVAALAGGQASIALLPQPFVTVAQTKIEGLRMALDLTAEWDALDNGSGLITGVIVARREAVEANPGAVDAFLQDYAASVAWVNANNADAAQLISEYGIVEAAPVAEKALPYCNIVCITGSEMKEKLSGYLQVLSDADAASTGGALPGDDFYYGA